MALDLTELQAAIDEAVAQATKTEGTEASAAVVIASFSAQVTKAVTDALTADAAANAGSISAAVGAIKTVTGRFAASDAQLGAAIAANPGAGGGTPNPNPPTP